MAQVFDSAISTYNPQQIRPHIYPDLQPRFGVLLKASTFYPAGSFIGEITATPGVFGLTITIANVALTSNVATVTTKGKHGLSVGDSVAVTAVTATTINGTGLTVASVPSATTFTYAKTASNVTSAADTGTVVRDAGTDTPKAVTVFDVTTDASGNIFIGDQTGGEFGAPLQAGMQAYFGGIYKASDIQNLTQVALTAASGKILVGALFDGTAFVKL